MAPSTQLAIADLLLGRGDHDATALIEGDRHLAYGELRAEVDVASHRLDLPDRSLVLLEGGPGIDWVVTYLALLQAGHVPLLTGARSGLLAETWQPEAAISVGPDGTTVEHRSAVGPRPVLHPDLALLLSTSGSTGSPKLVRLSHRNLTSNADAIATALGLRAGDAGITSLPLHYCYGLSVLHSHLAVGARMVLIDASVVDPCFARAVDRDGVTSIAGVPHTFDLLEAHGPQRVLAPSVRLLTQAGGRLPAEAAARWRDRAAGAGFDLVVMYGQTEATARMAVLPPELAAAHPDAVGVAVPGGELRIEPLADGGDGTGDDGVGEVVYRGPNVMMGYAVEARDLAAGPQLTELRTGDLGRLVGADGALEIVGRISRFTKPFGLRIDLDGLEDRLGSVLGDVAVTGTDDLLVVVAPGHDPAMVATLAQDATGLPRHLIHASAEPIPRTTTGKAAYRTMLDRATAPTDPDEDLAGSPTGGAVAASVILAEILGRTALRPDETFVSAGGDSLSYIEAAMRLEPIVGTLPEDWHHRPIEELDALVPRPGRTRVDTTVALRAAGICAVVATHMHLVFFPGGAHLLLAVVGYNLSRFQLAIERTGPRVAAGLRTLARVAIPTILWTAAMFALGRGYAWTTIGLVNNYLGTRGHEQGRWHFWFVEALVQLTLVLLALLAIPAVRRLDRRHPYLLPLGVFAATVVLRTLSVGELDDPLNLRFRTHGVAWFFVLGWLIQRSRTVEQRLLTSVLCLVAVADFFGQPHREAFIAGGLLLLIWCRTIPIPRRVGVVAATLAAASMWILITHFQVWPALAAHLPIGLAYPATIAVGVAAWKTVETTPRLVRRWRAAARAGAGRPVEEPSLRPQGAVA